MLSLGVLFKARGLCNVLATLKDYYRCFGNFWGGCVCVWTATFPEGVEVFMLVVFYGKSVASSEQADFANLKPRSFHHLKKCY